ncbi:MAG: gamma-glutamyl-gamma-aminobutyrate hydrolase family protein [Ancrocorticia sp.]|jgi:para-aminobenzoate synthetase component 2|nr:gamma-glutamyl-gamma-aminobutyrate hydrolase family protein [Ancrocorticia sp.]MCI1896251.1 gamma-glutamyl-gamma-aminobutyrate hydrolase family protein [Ancrocorticia sp.]MCI1963656.1 gamma-glutamyl-gamma-aminobutyrate hydrolase family protein [Ancrocorticia sp.]MCI2002755.1 gamma-glutamyl-gamma-aminobutyrate hydrolase family protein [Ancrocorticia sp.]MCI2012075.1 gamma-glutamyl-gamma-aminobutyrate hydrolase family protein [Ancrocorticia sp.]
MMRILVVDNYDSFVYTIVDYIRQLGAETTVVRNDVVAVDSVASYDGVLVSPGPGTPAEAGLSQAVIGECARTGTPMLGVCLGHQALAEYFGGTVTHAPELMHGKTSLITHTGEGVFAELPSPLRVTRYHSLAADPDQLPASLRVTATTDKGIVMALEHRDLPLWGVQFHPEAVLTQGGHRMFANWLEMCGSPDALRLAEGKSPLMRANV